MGLIGYDYYGLARDIWPMKDTIKYTPAGSAIGFMDDVFGDPIPHFKQLLAEKNKDGTPKYPAYRVQMHYNSNHGLISTSQLMARCKLYEPIAKNHPDVKFYMSHTVEYTDRNAAAVKARIEIIKKYAPHWIPVNNMWTGVGTPGVMVETHDITKKHKGTPYLVSTDGNSVTQMDMDLFHSRFANSEIRFLWASRFNLRDASNPLPSPMQRTAVPSADYLQAIVRLASVEGVAPKPNFSGRIVPMKSPLLWKAFAEDSPKDPRANRPLLICPSTSGFLSVITKDGKEVTKMKFYGNYPPNLHRFYIGNYVDMYGYEIGAKALKMSGSEFIWVRDGNTVYGPINPGFRTGYFRDD